MAHNDNVIGAERKEGDDAAQPSAADTRLIETRMIAANGLVFEVDMCGNGDRLALCLHGFPELAFSWRHQLPVLARLGFRAWAPNLRGYGRTTRPPRVKDYAIDHLVADVAALIDHANPTSVVLIGHDWGGAIAWTFALRHERALQRLVVMNMPHPALFYAGVRRFPQALRSWYIAVCQIPWLPERALGAGRAWLVGQILRGLAADRSRFPPSVVDVYRTAASQPGALTAMVNYYRALKYAGPAATTRPDTPLQVPTLLIWGEPDAALDKRLTVGTDRLVESLVVRFLPGVSHWVQQEAPETVNAILEAWLRDQPLAPDSDQSRAR